ncbi:BTAD domain-containing putative transcriptional regulator [Amycolatopsis sp. NPDC059657]|uniref:BTAD domain-containing putative transcriptional regulator n=1 Tax=Amycolatopsis sp. NPDC059657 TaxID=3346899 RepID=UPI00366F5AAA
MTATSRQSRREPTRSPRANRGDWWALAGVLRFLCRTLEGLAAAAVLLVLVAGVPWALWHYIGWPLPNHVPMWAEVEGVLLGPMTATFLLDFLACLCWMTWAAFTLDVARCAVEAARNGVHGTRRPDFSAAGPMHALAGLLVGAVLLAVLGNRAVPAPPAALSAALGTGSQVVATAPAWQHPAPDEPMAVRNAAQAIVGGGTTVRASAHAESVVVLAPRGGVHDSLWRIAQRTLGDGTRWPEIFEANQGKPQPNGHTFTKPSLIFPGEELALPRNANAQTEPPRPAVPDQSSPSPVTPPPPATAAPPTSIRPSTAAPPAASPQARTDATETHPDAMTGAPGLRWGTELFVGLGLAAAVGAALLAARRRYRGKYRPGSGDRDDLPVAPVVYQLRLAHLRAEADDEIDLDEDCPEDGEQRSRCVPAAPPLVVGVSATGAGRAEGLVPGLGVRDGREVALDLATARGLGLIGAGAPAAARALLVAALATAPGRTAPSDAAIVIAPVDDLVAVLGRGATQQRLPSAVRVVDDLEEALDVVEAETLVRASASREPGVEAGTWLPLVLVARPPAQPGRLQAVLDNGAPFGVTGLLLGQWQPGVTCYVRSDGTISSTGPGLGEALRGARMFRLGDDDAADLLALLHDAEPESPATGAPAGAPPRPRSRSVMTHPAGNDQMTTVEAARLETSPPDTGELELEVTAAVAQPSPPDTALEILVPRHDRTRGVRPQPGNPNHQRLAVPPAAGDEASHLSASEADQEPASTGEHSSPATDTSPTAPGEQDTDRASITVNVLGGLRVRWHPEPGDAGSSREITGTLQPRTKELLVLLALHPAGATRETLVSALWGQDPPARPTNALHTALSRLRHAVAAATAGAVTDIVSAGNDRYLLDPATVRSDYWRFARAVSARRVAVTDQARVDAYRDVVNSYGGALAEGMACEWIEPAREATRRDAIDAVAALARALVDSDPQQTLDLLEVARAFDPHNELLYRDIMRLQERLGQLDAIPRTLTLLTTRLAEVDATPTAQARGLAARLGQRHDDIPGTVTTSRGHGERGHSAAS